jgi:phosphohistidine swiveling domain-containing protein
MKLNHKEKWWHWFERENIPVIYCNLRDSAHPFKQEFKDFAKTYLRHIFVWNERVLHVYWRQEDLDNFDFFYLGEIINQTDFMEKLEKYHYLHARDLINFSRKFNDIDFSKKTSKELLVYLEKFEELYSNLSLYTYIPVIGSFSIERVTEPFLREKLKGKEEKYGAYLSILTYHGKKSWVRREEEGLFKIAQKVRDGKSINDPVIMSLLDKHTEKYCWLELGYQFLGKPLSKEEFILKLKDLLEDGIKKIPSSEEIRKEAKKITKELNIDTKHLLLFKALGKIIYLKEYRDGIYCRSHYEFNVLLCEILNRFKINNEFGAYMKLSEYKDLLNGKRLDIEDVKDRVHLFVWLCDRKEEYYTGLEAEKIIKREIGEIGPRYENIAEVQGVVASSGKVRGFVKVVKNESELYKVKQGDILVTYMTKPSYLSAMKKAIAFVTNEGGITCHAAIISREMKKPCIIGTKIATKVFKDGNLIEVDANKGIVRKIR